MLRLCYPTYGCCRPLSISLSTRSAQTCCDRSIQLWEEEFNFWHHYPIFNSAKQKPQPYQLGFCLFIF